MRENEKKKTNTKIISVVRKKGEENGQGVDFVNRTLILACTTNLTVTSKHTMVLVKVISKTALSTTSQAFSAVCIAEKTKQKT